MVKQLNYRLIISLLLVGLWGIPAVAADVAFSKESTLAGIIQRGELRIGLEAGYMPFEMIDTRSGSAPKGDPARRIAAKGGPSAESDGL